MLSNEFFIKLNDMCKRLGMNPRDLLLVMYMESGLNPAAYNKEGAAGLIQFTESGTGWNKAKVKNFTKVPAEKQLDYVEKYIRGKGRVFKSATQYYHANFFPFTLTRWHGDDPIANANVVVVSSKSKDPRERMAYKSNPILDVNKDGRITVGDLTSILTNVSRTSGFQNALRQLNAATSTSGNVSDFSKKQPVLRPKKPHSNNFLVSTLLSNLSHILDSFASKTNIISKYGSNYPANKYLISINSESDFSSKLEFAKILSLALKEELDSDSDIYTNGTDVELQCIVDANTDTGKNVVIELSRAMSDAFEIATKKIGSIKIYSFVSENENSEYNKLDKIISDLNYRKFNLKFAR